MEHSEASVLLDVDNWDNGATIRLPGKAVVLCVEVLVASFRNHPVRTRSQPGQLVQLAAATA